jgi:hypothetical protein
MSPSAQLGRLDGVARFLFATWQINAFMSGAGAIVLAFTVVEVLFGVLQFWRVDQESLGSSRGLRTESSGI